MAFPSGWTVLAPLSAGLAATPWAISADGSTVVGSAEDSDGLHAVYWTDSAGPVDMPVPLDAGTQHAVALSVSDDGSVIVGYFTLLGGEHRAFRWTQADGMVALDPRGAGLGIDGQAFACNGDGTVIVGSNIVPFNSFQPFIWTLADGFVDTGGPGGTTQGDNIGVSPDGNLVYIHSRDDDEFYSWTTGDGWVDSTVALQANAFFPGGVIITDAGAAFQIGSDNDTSDAIMQQIAPVPGSVILGIPPTGTFAQADAAPTDASVLVGTWTDDGFNVLFFSWTEADGFVSIDPPATYTADFVSDFRSAIAADGSAFVAALFDGSSVVTPAVYGLSAAPPSLVVTINGITVERRNAGGVLQGNLHTDPIGTGGAADMVYTITTAPTRGTLLLSGEALSVSDTFTQADIDDGHLSYSETGATGSSDSFVFTVVDTSE
jgi:probable HAF family extracellular repeat protein